MHLQVLSTMQKALQAEQPGLLELLRTRLLPVLVACLEPLTVQELAWATGCEADIGKLLVTSHHASILLACRVWDLAIGSGTQTLWGQTHHVASVALSPDGKTLASGSRYKIIQHGAVTKCTLAPLHPPELNH
ncbi:hypothetical protein QJQ45_026602 [Haematococcus lacustris]|nr:hypothetical protein QJQ45_026602 [Haematococcus lacustris]